VSLEIRILGELLVLRKGSPVVLPASKKTRALLGYLVVCGNRLHARQALCDLFWDGPEDPRAALRWSLSKLRPLIDDAGARRLSTDREHVTFEAGAATIDLVSARQLDLMPATASTEALRAAAALFRGELLEGLDLPGCYRYHEWCVAEREAARRTRVAILAALTERLAGAPADALSYARARVAVDPLAEAAHIAVMQLLATLGRPRDAIKQYESCRRILDSQLGRKPSAELEAARMALGQDPAPKVSLVPAAPEPARVARHARSPLVGRTAERAKLVELVGEAAQGTCARVLLVTGEPGIGKTRLLQEAADQTLARGGVALVGRAFEAEMVRPYGPWIDALRSAPLGAIDDSLRVELAPLLPELGTAHGEADRNRLFDAVTKLLSARARIAPLVVALDDVQWFDEASSALLHYVARAVVGSHVLIACAARPAEIDENVHAQGLIRGLARDGRLIRVDLAPLDVTDTAELVRTFDGDVDPAQVFADGGGNPLFSIELARALARGNETPTHTLDGLIAERLSRLDERASELVPWTAALGRAFSVDTLAVLTSLKAGELLGALETLERHGVLRVASSALGSVGYDYAHDLVRRTAYRSMTEPRRRWIHLHIARSLAATSDPESLLAGDVAHHASLGGDSELAARAYVSAGERCLRVCAYAEACELAARGRQHIERLPLDLRAELRIALLSVHVLSNQWLRRPRELESELSSATLEAQRRGMHAQVARGFFLLSYLHNERGDLGNARVMSLRAAEAGRAADPRTARHQLANSGRCLALIERDLVLAEALLREAEKLTDDDERRTALELAFGLGLVHAHKGEQEAAVSLLERAAELAASEGDHWSQGHAVARLAAIAIERGKPREALARCDVLDPIAARLGEGSEGPFAEALRALARLALGEVGAASEVEHAITSLRAIDSKAHLAYVLDTLAEHLLVAGDSAGAWRRAKEALGAAEAVGQTSEAAVARALLARVAVDRGARDEALALLRACGPDLGRPMALNARACAAVAQAAGQAGVSIPSLVA
jgi:DNA-binding SARP family transcriptional activator/tetratricopeptide (TPR) repeat protein